MNVLTVRNLRKQYEHFTLNNIDFDLEEGKITGFIGRNGAGKTTTLKSLLNFVHPDDGEIQFFGKSFKESELEIKQRIGFTAGEIDYYPTKKIKAITATTHRFYNQWDCEAYRNYTELFELDGNKTPNELSAGMRVKYTLALALSHNAELLILDEPTTGLDPVSRDDLLEIFLELAEKGITILFSTHITSDLDKCADNIIYIRNGNILASADMDSYLSQYKILEFTDEQLADDLKQKLIGCRKNRHGYSALIKSTNCRNVKAKLMDADLKSIMVHLEKE